MAANGGAQRTKADKHKHKHIKGEQRIIRAVKR